MPAPDAIERTIAGLKTDSSAAHPRTRLEPGANIEQRIRDVDAERAHYLKLRFGKEWNNPHLYDLMISSGDDEERTARVIEFAMWKGSS